MIKNLLSTFLLMSIAVFAHAQEYCTPGSRGSLDYIDGFTTSGASINIESSLSTGYTAGGYNDNSASFVLVQPGGEFNYSITTNYSRSYVTLWVDWNNDKIFSDEEQLSSTSGSPINGSITLPVDALEGDYRMRLEMHPSYISPDPCSTSLSYGEYEDFTIRVGAPPSCPAPSNLVINNTSSTADITWTAGSDETAWEVVVQEASMAEPTSGTIVSETSFSVTDLLVDQEYTVYVRSNCADENSDWLKGNFITGYCLPTGDKSYAYIKNIKTAGGTINIDQTSADDANGYGDYTSSVLETFEDGKVDLTITNSGNYFGNTVWVDYNKDFSFTDDEIVFNTISYNSSSNQTTGSFTIPTGTLKGDYRLRVGSIYFGSNISDACSTIDGEFEDYTLRVGAAPSCINPTNIVFSNPTQTSMDISWTAGSDETSWEILVQEAGLGSPNSGVTVSQANYSATELTPDTSYEVYVRANCTDSNSVWTEAATFITGYCQPSTLSPSYYVDSFVANGTENVSTGAGTNGYQDNSTTIINVNAGNELDFTVNTVQEFSTYFTIWVDFNKDFIFEDSERIYSKYGNNDFNSKIQIPIDFEQGEYKLRIAIGTANESCSTTFGEFEDFTLLVKKPNIAPGIENTCVSSEPVTISGTLFNTFNWIPLYVEGNLVAMINANGQTLGDVTVNLYMNTEGIRQDEFNSNFYAFLDRNFSFTSTNSFSNPVSLRLFFNKYELNELKSKAPSTDISTLSIRHGKGGTCSGTFDVAEADSENITQTSNATISDKVQYLEFDTSSFSSFFIEQEVAAKILPVELSSFTGEYLNNSTLLTWSTESEINNSHFDVERSFDGSSFEKIGTVSGNGNYAGSYSYNDDNNNSAYYRLKQVDFDGGFEYSNIIFVENLSSSNVLNIYPNPVKDLLTVEYNLNSAQSTTIKVVNIYGSTLYNKIITGKEGNNKATIDTKDFAQGVYYLSIENNGKSTTQKIIKQ